jgi:nucleotide-binding universal stress UspA family protein
MRSLRRILVPFDCSEISAAALDQAIVLAQATGAAVVVFHASGAVVPHPDTASQEQRDVGQMLADALLRHRERAPVELSQEVRWVSPLEGINRLADEIDADLLVMGTHGRRGLSRAFVGSVAESVLRTSTRPVLTLRGPTGKLTPPSHILVATDFSEAASRALAYAVDLARLLRARVTLAHVFPSPLPIMSGETSLVSAEMNDHVLSQSQAALNEATAPHRGSGVPIQTATRDGDAARVLPLLAADLRADLVVVGTHGRQGLARAFLGSVAEQVLRTAEVPVLVRRFDARESARAGAAA